MAAWAGRNDLNPLCEVRALPKTIEEFLAQNQSTTSTIHRIQNTTENNEATDDAIALYSKEQNAIVCYTKDGGPKRTPTNNTNSRNNNQDARKSADIYCDGCGMHGHGWRKCDFCTKVIKSTEFIASLEPAKKKELQKQKANTAGRARLLQASDIDNLFEVLAQL